MRREAERTAGTSAPQLLIRDRDSKYTRAFDDVFTCDGIQIITTPVQAPNAGAFAERWVRTVRRECPDWMLIWSRRYLEQVLDEYLRHDNDQRPHRGLALRPPSSIDIQSTPSPSVVAVADRVRRRDRLGGPGARVLPGRSMTLRFLNPTGRGGTSGCAAFPSARAPHTGPTQVDLRQGAYAGQAADRPADRALIVRMARESSRWGCVRIAGELRKLGIRVGATTIRTLLRRHGLGPVPRRTRPSWTRFGAVAPHAGTDESGEQVGGGVAHVDPGVSPAPGPLPPHPLHAR
jgi:Integrase core domain